MKTAVIILLIGVAYAVIGYVFVICVKAWGSCKLWDLDEDENLDEDECAALGAMWAFVLPFLVLYVLVKFIGKRLAVIPVMIIALIKAKKED